MTYFSPFHPPLPRRVFVDVVEEAELAAPYALLEGDALLLLSGKPVDEEGVVAAKRRQNHRTRNHGEHVAVGDQLTALVQ